MAVPKLDISFLGFNLTSPLILVSGINSLSYSTMVRAVKNGASMVITKSLSKEPRVGHKGPVIVESWGGIINSMGLPNPGIKEGLKEVEEFKKVCNVPIIISIFSEDKEGFVELAKTVEKSGLGDGLELNLSCPNVEDEFGRPFSLSQKATLEIVTSVKEQVSLPVIVKLSPNIWDMAPIAKVCEHAGADALELINTVGPCMAIDIESKKPILSNRYGGLSGPCIKPLAIKKVFEVTEVVKIPVIGGGGILYGEDAIEMMMAGATLVGIGTGIYYRGFEIFSLITKEMVAWMKKHKIKSITEIKRITI